MEGVGLNSPLSGVCHPFQSEAVVVLGVCGPPLLPDPSLLLALCLPISPPSSPTAVLPLLVLVLSSSALSLASPSRLPSTLPFLSVSQTLISLTNAVWISVRREGMVERAWGGPVGGGGSPHPKAIYNSVCLRPALLPLPSASSLALNEPLP